jgi:hypothetical protein
VQEVSFDTETLLPDKIGTALGEDAVHLRVREVDLAFAAGAGRDTSGELVDEGLGARSPSSRRVNGVASSRTPQLISKPTPPGETTPSGMRVAATPPTGKP